MSGGAVVVDEWRKRLAAQMMGGQHILPITHMAFGTGGHKPGTTQALSPSVAATALNHEVLRKPVAHLFQETPFSVTAKGFIENNEANGEVLSEVGLFDAGGNLVGLRTFSPHVKDSDERYEISIQLRF